MSAPSEPDFAKGNGLVPCVCQDARTGRVLMVAWMDRTAYDATLATKRVHFFSRSRQAMWMKGETSGNVLALDSLHLDCDADTLLAMVVPTGPACHTGATSCFFTPLTAGYPGPVLDSLWAVIEDRKANPKEGSWTNKLLDDVGLAAAKVAEEAGEAGRAAHGDPEEDDVPHEVADLMYHAMVLVAAADADWVDVLERLRNRRT